MKPRKPLKRSSKPIQRKALKRGLGKKGKARSLAMAAIRKIYALRRCQWMITPIMQCPWTGESADFHHKKLRSQGGKDVAENLVALCRAHHSEAHLDFAKLERIRKSGANLLNGEVIK